MSDYEIHQRYLRGWMDTDEESEYEAGVSIRPHAAAELRESLVCGGSMDPRMALRARALLAMIEAFPPSEEDVAAAAKLDLAPFGVRIMGYLPHRPVQTAEQPSSALLVNYLLVLAIRERAQEMHLLPRDDLMVVEFVKDRKHREVFQRPLTTLRGTVARLKRLARVDPGPTTRWQHGEFQATHDRHFTNVRALFYFRGELELAILSFVTF